ncbi:hypothetical protein CQ018_13700 [Arthrobacter sp. MYb227]|nr:hypothetical protein CQ018_13700 [Arthrobacter sp. MYb227]
MARNVVANLESGRRTTLTVAELLAFASVLAVPASVLIVDALDLSGEAIVDPSRRLSNYEAIFSVTGLGVLESPDPLKSFFEHRLEDLLSLQKAEYLACIYAADTAPAMRDIEIATEEEFRERHRMGPQEFKNSRQENLRYWLLRALWIRYDIMVDSDPHGTEGELFRGLIGTQPPLDARTHETYKEARLSNLLATLLSENPEILPSYEEMKSYVSSPSIVGMNGGILDGDD